MFTFVLLTQFSGMNSKAFDDFLPKLRIIHKFEKDAPLNYYLILMLLRIDYFYHSKSIPDEEIDFVLEKMLDVFQKTQDEDIAMEVIIGVAIKIYFEKMDKRIDKFAEKWGRNVLKNYEKEINLEIESFSDLLLSNASFFQEKFFPNVSLTGIEDLSQVIAVIEGKYFRYMTKKKEFFHDLSFNFE
jgi:hypothetical protein